MFCSLTFRKRFQYSEKQQHQCEGKVLNFCKSQNTETTVVVVKVVVVEISEVEWTTCRYFVIFHLTVSKTTNFRSFQTARVCRRQL